ncbi:MAG: CAP domain-containing protein [Acidobacteriota bacterium]
MKKISETKKRFFKIVIPLLILNFFQLNAVYIKESEIRKSEKEMLQFINLERSSRGIKPVEYNAGLFRAAELHNRKMIEMKKLSHTFKNYNNLEKRISNVDVFFSNAGENIAYSTVYVSDYIHNGFIKSKLHKKNILDRKFTHCGISIIETKKGFYITQEFAHILPPADNDALEKTLKVIINNYCYNKYGLTPVFLNDYRKKLLIIAEKVLNGEKVKKIPENIHGFNMVNIATSSRSEILNFLISYISKTNVTGYSLGVTFGRSQKFIGGAFSVSLFLSSEYIERPDAKKISEEITIY